MKKSMLTKLLALVLMIGVVFSLAIIVSSAAEEKSATITFDNTSKRTTFSTSQQVWEENDLVVTNNKASSTNNVADYAKPARFYANSELIITAPGNITKIVFDANSSSYATDMKNSVSGSTASSDKVTIELDGSSNTFTVAKLTAQIRMDAITVTYESAVVDPVCEHANTTETRVEATKGEPGSITVTCVDCGAEVDKEIISALGYNITFSVPDGIDTPTAEDALSVKMPECSVPTGSFTKEYTFAGWATASANNTTELPKLYQAGETVELNSDTTFYAIYTYSIAGEGGSATNEYVLGDATNGATVVITMTTASGTVYALSSANGTSAAPAATVVTVSGSKLDGTVADALKWTVAKDGDSYIFYPNGDTSKWLYCTSTNNGVRVGTNADKTFTIDSASGYLKHTGTNRYVGVYTSTPDWRCYTNTTGNTANQTLGFYVLTTSGGATTYYTSVLETSDCDHNWGEGEETKAPTCTENGILTYTCSLCGNTKTATIDALGHNYEESETKAATCTETGIKTYTCSRCADSYPEDIPMISHNYVDGVCTVCKAEKPSGYTLLTDVSQLKPGVKIIIVAANADFAMSTTQNTNNRAQIAIDKNGDFIVPGDGVLIITLENGLVDGTFAFNTGDGYLYAASSGSNYLKTKAGLDENGSWLITVENGVATIKAQGDCTRNWIRYNSTNNPPIFSCYGSGQNDVAIYVSDEHVHEWNDGEVTTNPSCVSTGVKTYTCNSCGETKTEEIPVSYVHNYVNNVCSVCGTEMIGRYYVATKRTSGNFFWMTGSLDGDNNRYVATDSGYALLPYEILSADANASYVFVLEKLGDVYFIYAEGIEDDAKWLGWTSGNSGTFVTKENALKFNVDYDAENGTYQFHWTASDNERYLSLNGSTGKDYFAFYTGTQKQNLSLIPIVEEATPAAFKSVSVKLGTDLALLYTAFVPNGTPSVTFNFNGNTVTVTDYVDNGDFTYTFTFEGIGPHQMATLIDATLYVDGEAVDSHNGYSVNTNLNNISNGASDKLKAVIDATIAYGVKAAAYGTKTEDTTIDLSGITVDASVQAPTTTDASQAYFKSAGVYFDVTNRIFVKFFAVDGFSIKIGATDVTEACEALGNNEYKLYTDAITATSFDKDFVFAISFNEVDVATLTYSVNAYAAAMQRDDIPEYVKDLAKALYAYGEAAKNYPTV